jgi:valyl-tRNA synthetase
MTEKRQTSLGYIIRILQHFATKLWNITNFVSDALSSCGEMFV